MAAHGSTSLRDAGSVVAAVALVVMAACALAALGLAGLGLIALPAGVPGLSAGSLAIPIVILTALAEPDPLEASSDELRS